MTWQPRLFLESGGGTPPTPPTDPPPEPPAPTPPAPDPKAAPPPAPAAPVAAPGAPAPVMFKMPDGTEVDVAQLQRDLGKARTDVTAANRQAADRRVAAGKVTVLEAQLAALSKALGITLPEDPVAAAQVAQEWKDKYAATRLENEVMKVAVKLGAKPELTLRYLRGGPELANLDPDADDYATTVEGLVQVAVEAEASLKLAPAPTPVRGGAPFTGPERKTLQQEIEDAEKAGNTSEVIRLKMAQAEVATPPS